MFYFLTLPHPMDDVASYRKLHLKHGVPWRPSREENRKTIEPWVARILGRDSTYGLKREFVAGKKDYSAANADGSKGVFAYYALRDGVYEVNEPISRKESLRYFLRVTSGAAEEITKEEAESVKDQPIAKPERPLSKFKVGLGIDVLGAAELRIEYVFDHFPRICVSFSGGKDSTVMLHLVMEEAMRRGRKVGILFIDLEAQYRHTIDHVAACYDMYRDHIEPYWVALPLHLRNAVSQYQPHWVCWEGGAEKDWVRPLPDQAISDPEFFPFFRHAMEFEEFVEEFGWWYGDGKLCCQFVGIRADESLNRWRTVAGEKSMFEGKRWTTWKSRGTYNAYPIYDWRTEDIWTYHAKHQDKPHNRLYDLMHKAGLSIHQQRICQPYGDDQRKGLWLYHLIEPETWGRVVARVNGANQGSLYAGESGNILGNLKISKPPGHTWESFAKLILESLPPKTRDHYEDKIATFVHWWRAKGVAVMPDEADAKLEAARDAPSWRRICKALLRNDYWCKGLSFTQTESSNYTKYKVMMKRRRAKWGII